jgi:hypothetical protein
VRGYLQVLPGKIQKKTSANVYKPSTDSEQLHKWKGHKRSGEHADGKKIIM